MSDTLALNSLPLPESTAGDTAGPWETLPGRTGVDPDLRIPARDGFKLAATLYEPGPGGGGWDTAVLINSATAAKRGYYDGFARYLRGRGFAVLTYDYRGIGDSRPKSLGRFKAGLHQWGEADQAGVIDWISDHLRPRQMLVVGHSVGGQIVGLADNNHKVDALLGVAAQDGYFGHWPASARFGLALRWYLLVPVLSRAFGYVPGWAGTVEDLPGGVARDWARWCRHPEFLFRGAAERYAGFERFHKPLLGFSFTDDAYAPRPAVESWLSFYANAEVTHRHVAPREIGADAIGHFGFFRSRFRDSLWRQAADWLEAVAQDNRQRDRE